MPDATTTQSSLVTIFAIWNTMMGTSLLTMPWATAQAGLGMALVCVVGMGLLCLYTSYRVYDSPRFLKVRQGAANPRGEEPYKQLEEDADIQGKGVNGDLCKHPTNGIQKASIIRGGGDVPAQCAVEFLDVCADVLGPVGKWSAVAFSIIALVGALIVFWELMSKFAENLALFAYGLAQHNLSIVVSTDLVCSGLNGSHLDELGFDNTEDHTWLHNLIVSRYTWPCLLIIIIFPLVNIKSPTFFQRFSAFGTIAIVYLLGYNTFNGVKWGGNLDFTNHTSMHYDSPVKASFPSMTGVLCLSFFIQNCVLTLMRFQANPNNNVRDLCIGYALVMTTYILIGIPFYITFPEAKSCIADNFLQNFSPHDILATVTRAFLLLQYMTLFPQISFITRVQTLEVIWPRQEYTRLRIFLFNAVVVATCVIVSIFVGDISLILRYCGALCGLAYVFTLPSLVYILGMRRLGKLTPFIVIVHGFIIVLGIANFVAQFLMRNS